MTNVYKPNVSKYASLPAAMINGIKDNMNQFILGNLDSALFSNCIALLDNDPNPDQESSFYKAATYLMNVAENKIIQRLDTGSGTASTNVNMNPNLYRVTLIGVDGTVVFDSSKGLNANVSARPLEPVIPENHNTRSCVMRALTYPGTDIQTFNEF